MNGFQRRAAVLTTIAGLAFLSLAGVASAGNDHGQGEHHPVTICHRTDSNTNPYVVITVDDNSVHFAGHEGHDGPVWDPTLKAQHIKWGDIIPPTDNDGDVAITPKNWTDAGQAIYNNGCAVPEAPTTTTTEAVTSTTTVPETTTTQPEETTLPPTTTTTESPTSTSTLPPETTTVPVVCQEECPVTTTTTSGPVPTTTSTSSPSSTSTTLSAPGTTTLPHGSPKPTVPTPPASTPTGNLAFTGSDSLILLLGAFLALCAGVGLVLLGGPKHRPGGPGDEAY